MTKHVEVTVMVKRVRAEATWESYAEAFGLFLRGAAFAEGIIFAGRCRRSV